MEVCAAEFKQFVFQVDFELQEAPFYFMSTTTDNLKLSFEQCVLKIPKYQLEPSLYNALLTKMEHNPLKMWWESNDIIIHTIGKGAQSGVY